MTPRIRISPILPGGEETHKSDKVTPVVKLFSGLTGIAAGINGAVRLTADEVKFPYIGHELAQHLPLGFYQAMVVILVSGKLANYDVHAAVSTDIFIDRMRNFPWSGTADDRKNWWNQFDITHLSDAVGLLFGLGLSATFIYYNAQTGAPFSLTYGAEKGIPNVLMQIAAPLTISGACANSLTYFVQGLRLAVYGGIDSVCWVASKINRPLPEFKHDNPHTKMNTPSNFLTVPGLLVGLGYGINGAARLRAEHLKLFPNLSEELAAQLPLAFYQSVLPILIGGTVAKFYNHLGLAAGVAFDAIKEMPWKGSSDEWKNWLISWKQCDLKNISHVVGALFGIGLSGAFIYYNATSNDPFSLGYGIEEGIPNVLLQVGAPLYMGGLGSTFFSYFTDVTRQAISTSTYSINFLGTKAKSLVSSFSFFSKTVNALPPPPAAPPSPTLSVGT